MKLQAPLIILALCATYTASAQPATDTDKTYPGPRYGYPSHFYAGMSVSASQLEPKVNDAATVSVDDSDSISKKAFIGYQLNRKIQLEAFYKDLGAASISKVMADDSVEKGEISYTLAGVSARYNFPVGNTSDVFLRLGYAKVDNDSDNDAITYRKHEDYATLVGLGYEMRLNKKISASAEYEYVSEDIQSSELSMMYNF